MDEKTPNPFKIPTGILAKKEPVKTDRAQELGLSKEEFAKREAKKAGPRSIEIDLVKLGTDPTIERPLTPVPAPPPTYSGIKLRLEPTMVTVGTAVRVTIIGIKADDGAEVDISDSDRATATCNPANAGAFAFGAFTPSKDGAIIIHAAASDAGGAEVHQDEATLIVNAADKVEFSHSMQNVMAPTKKPAKPEQPKASKAPKPDTLDGLPVVQRFFGQKPKAVTVGGSPIHATVAPPTTPPVQRPPQKAMQMPAASGWRFWLSRNWVKVLLIAVGGSLTAVVISTASYALLNLTQEAPAPADATLPDASPVELVTDAVVIAPPASVVAPPPPEVAPSDPGLDCTRHGTRALASVAFPNACVTGWSNPPDGVLFLCAPEKRNGDDVCACDAICASR